MSGTHERAKSTDVALSEQESRSRRVERTPRGPFGLALCRRWRGACARGRNRGILRARGRRHEDHTHQEGDDAMREVPDQHAAGTRARGAPTGAAWL